MSAVKTVGIVGGTGAMGRLFTPFFKNSGLEVLVSNRSSELSSRELCSRSDWIIFCVPITETLKAIADNARFARKGAIVSDFTSVKQEPLKAMLKHARSDCSVVGIHPLFGPSIKSLKGQKVALVKGHGKGFAFVKGFFKNQGCEVLELSAVKHDELMALVQGANHFDNIAFALSLADSKLSMTDFEKAATPNFRLKLALVSRIIEQNPKLYADIILQNKNALKSIGEFSKSVLELQKIVKAKDSKALEKVLARISRKFGKGSKALFSKSQDALQAMR